MFKGVGKTNRTPPVEDKNSGMSASDTDFGSKASSEDLTKATRKRTKRIAGENHGDDFSCFQAELRDMFTAFTSNYSSRLDKIEKSIASQIKTQTEDLRDTYLGIEKSIDYMSGQLASLDSKILIFEEQRKEMATSIVRIDDKIESVQRELTKTCIEIRGVPKKQKETKHELYELVQNAFKLAQQEFSPISVRDVFRLPSKQEQTVSTVVVELSNTLIKTEFLDGIKKYTRSHPRDPLQSSVLGLKETKSVIYISDHLTPKMRRLHYLAREFVKTEGFAFCWTTNGRVFIRKQEGHPYINIKSEDQLASLRKAK